MGVPPLPHTPSWGGAQGEHRDNFMFRSTVITHSNTNFRFNIIGLHTIQEDA